MQKHVSFDADEYVRQLREAVNRDLHIALAAATNPIARAGIKAQHALLPAQENFVRVHIGLREAGHPDTFIAQVAGCLAGSFLVDLLLNAADRGAVTEAFIRMLFDVVDEQGVMTTSMIEVEGRPMGAA